MAYSFVLICILALGKLTILPMKIVPDESGYPAWIRTKNNASKGRCVTVTPRGKSAGRFTIFDGATEVATRGTKNLPRGRNFLSAKHPKDAKINKRTKASGSAERHPTI